MLSQQSSHYALAAKQPLFDLDDMSALSADVDFFNTNQLLPQCAPFTLQMIRVSTIEHNI